MAKKTVDTTQFETPEELSPGIDPIDRPAEMEVKAEDPTSGEDSAKEQTSPEETSPSESELTGTKDYRAPTIGRIVRFRYGAPLPDYAALVTMADGESLTCDLLVFTNDGQQPHHQFAVPWGYDKRTWHWPEFA